MGPLPLEVELRPGSGADEKRRATDLLAELKRRVAEIGDGVVPFRPGRVYCFWCRSNACEHGRPVSPKEVFIGYDPTGRPRFTDFGDLVLARSDPRIEGIYSDPPVPVAVYDSGKTLRADQLPVFGGRSAAFHVLGQVAIGYLLQSSARPGERPVFSLTFQAIETRGADGRILLDLNILGMTPEGTLEAWMDTAFDGAVYDAVQRARRRIRDAGRQQKGQRHRGALEAAVEPHLNELARTFERFYRQAGRRTAHLETRRREGGRPTHMALDDLRRARPGAFYRDEKHGTYVVLGPRGRTHVFNPDGLHITSVHYTRDAVERKQKLRLWRELARDEIDSFRISCASAATRSCASAATRSCASAATRSCASGATRPRSG